MKTRQCAILVLFALCVVPTVNCGNILVWHTEGSHWINMKPVLDTLIERGHNVTMLFHNVSMFIDPKEHAQYNYHLFNASIDISEMLEFFEEFFHFSLYELGHSGYVKIYWKLHELMMKSSDFGLRMCDGILRSDTLMEKLKQGKYDLVFADPIHPCSELVAEILDIPFVYSLRFSMANSMERLCGQLPAPPSYVPGTMVKLTDQMSLTERLLNFVFYLVQDAMYSLMWRPYDQYYTEILDGSHWINMKPALDVLIDRGHKVTILFQNATMFINPKEHTQYNYHLFNVSISMTEIEEVFDDFLQFSLYELDHFSYVRIYWRLYKILSKDAEIGLKICDGILRSDALLEKLKQEKYDLLFADPLFAGSELLAEILDIPFVYSLRFSPANSMERLCGQLPAPPSYVPGTTVKLTDQMSFTERLVNFVFYLVQDAVYHSVWRKYNEYYSDILGKPTSFCELMGKADLWLIRTYWDFDYPRPILPNFKYIGGIHCKPAKPLPKDMEEFVQSSEDDGIVIFTLGSMIATLTKEKTNIIASALGQIPQKVLWRYQGERPETLAPNTRLYEWIPQNDLLGHPKTRAFVTHGGTNGLYEAIYHGVPMVGIPLFADQPDNMVHMKAKGAAVIMDYNTMQTKDLVDGLRTVINDPSYKASTMKLSKIHHDRPETPRDEAVFWIEHVMRNKGAKHLRVEAHNLSWYQYHSLDVFAFLIGIVLLVLFTVFKTCKICFKLCCLRSSNRKNKQE
ncbi:UDP-glucuronosyltransferase 2A1-like isoform X3 [Alosa sapidissima]|uniref:UDP-glucuronosyltransferase 2A1-like isoform X3 n=2 Tax=Alosa sapidissima TaxID=34773 RepID=UPI001C08A2A5|nr:UDP-glucuronosyltransferase 2A1-like isoform X3 [Alosa sapidissima]